MFQHISVYVQFKFHAKLRLAKKNFNNSCTGTSYFVLHGVLSCFMLMICI